MTASIDRKKAKKALEHKAKRVTESDVGKVVERKSEIDAKLSEVPSAFKRLVNQVKLLFEMVSDYWHGKYKAVPWYSISMAIAALLYFLNPFDLIPDFIPIVGYVDDATILALCSLAIMEDLRAYCKFKRYDPAQYF